MRPARRLIARIDVTFEISEPRLVARAAWIADWLRRVARVIERGDLPRGAHAGAAPGTTTPP
jgi:hypothetical protein